MNNTDPTPAPMSTTDRWLWVILIARVFALIIGIAGSDRAGSKDDDWKATIGIPYSVAKSGFQVVRSAIGKKYPHLDVIWPTGFTEPEFHVVRLRGCAGKTVTCYRFDAAVHGLAGVY